MPGRQSNVLQEPVEIDVLHPDDILPPPPPPTDVKPEIGFFFDPSIGVPIGDRKAVKRAVLEKFQEIDTGHVARDRWKNDLQREDIDSDGHIEESVIKDTLTTEWRSSTGVSPSVRKSNGATPSAAARSFAFTATC